MSNFGEWLADELARRRWSQADLCRKARLPSATISRLMRGNRNVGRRTLLALAGALDYPASVVLEAAGIGPVLDDASPALARLIEVARSLPDADIDELTHLALYKRDRR